MLTFYSDLKVYMFLIYFIIFNRINLMLFFMITRSNDLPKRWNDVSSRSSFLGHWMCKTWKTRCLRSSEPCKRLDRGSNERTLLNWKIWIEMIFIEKCRKIYIYIIYETKVFSSNKYRTVIKNMKYSKFVHNNNIQY